MKWEIPFHTNVTVQDHVVAVPCEHDALEHQADGVCFFGLVLTPAMAGGCETQASPCVVDVAIKAILGDPSYEGIDGEPVVILIERGSESCVATLIRTSILAGCLHSWRAG